MATLAFLAAGGGFIWPHALQFSVTHAFPAVLVTVRYQGGEVLSYVPVRVVFGDEAIEFQNGRTDRNGSFAFVPDRAGSWKFSADDEMGHLGSCRIDVGADFFSSKPTAEKQPNRAGSDFLLRLLAGIGAILALTGLLLFLEKRRHKT